ncbi:MAG: arginine--tRNA ligase, partial [Synergistaceae bacterium]|nr:arginine--tRNA ligase [Synergistaceae bacterium]
MNGRNTAVEKLNDALRESVKTFGVADADNIYAEFDRPKHEGHGDRAANVAMRLARPLRMNPKDIAAKIAVNLNSDVIDRTEIAGPGFVNVFLSGKFYAEVISDILEQGMNYGSVN